MSLLLPDTGLLFWMILSFGIVVYVLTKFGLPVILNMIEDRRDHITESLLEAQKAREESERLKKESSTILNEANREHLRIIGEAKNAAQEIIKKAEEEAQVKGEKMLEIARVNIQKEKEEALREVQDIVGLLSVDVAEKLIKTQLSAKDKQLDLINKLIDETYISKS